MIVEASLKLFPKPPERATFAMRAGTLGIARDLRRSILRSPLDAAAAGAARFRRPRRCWVIRRRRRSGRRRNCGSRWADRTGSLSVACLNSGNSPRRWGRRWRGGKMRRRRGSAFQPGPWLQQKYRDVTVLKAALPLVASEEFLSRAQQEAEAERIALASFAQVGVGIVHLCALQEKLTRRSCGLGSPPAPSGGRPWGDTGHRTLPGGPQEPRGCLGSGRRRSCRHAQNEICLGPDEVLAPGRFLGKF